jgi:hypothetical protein
MMPSVSGDYRVSDSILKQWKAGGDERSKVVKIFKECSWSRKVFEKHVHVSRTKHMEQEMIIDGDFLSEETLKNVLNLPEKLVGMSVRVINEWVCVDAETLDAGSSDQ